MDSHEIAPVAPPPTAVDIPSTRTPDAVERGRAIYQSHQQLKALMDLYFHPLLQEQMSRQGHTPQDWLEFGALMETCRTLEDRLRAQHDGADPSPYEVTYYLHRLLDEQPLRRQLMERWTQWRESSTPAAGVALVTAPTSQNPSLAPRSSDR